MSNSPYKKSSLKNNFLFTWMYADFGIASTLHTVEAWTDSTIPVIFTNGHQAKAEIMQKRLRKWLGDDLYWTLIRLRWIAITGQLSAILIVRYGIGMAIPMLPLLATLSLHAIWNLVSSQVFKPDRSQLRKRAAIELATDVLVLSTLFYLTGGPSNPFVFLYLVPITLTAIAWSWYEALLFSLVCIVAYTLLLFFNLPLPPVPTNFGSDFQLHMYGMWINFILSAFLIATAAASLSAAIRSSLDKLQHLREETLRDQQIISLGALAAGAAHELNTPLSTMSLLINELESSLTQSEQREDLQLLNQQVESCRRSVERLLYASGTSSLQAQSDQTAQRLFGQIAQHWSVTRPEIKLEVQLSELNPQINVFDDLNLRQAIVNILDNAADASLEQQSERVVFCVTESERLLTISIRDYGSGPPELDSGLPRESNKPGGHGLGLSLTSTSLGLLDAKLSLNPCQPGTLAVIQVKLSAISND